MNTAVKVLSATMPTKKAAIHSMESMKRSIGFLRTGVGGPDMTPSGEISGVTVMKPFNNKNRHSGMRHLAQARNPSPLCDVEDELCHRGYGFRARARARPEMTGN